MREAWEDKIHSSAKVLWAAALKEAVTDACSCSARTGCDQKCTNQESSVACDEATCNLTEGKCNNRWPDGIKEFVRSLTVEPSIRYRKDLVWAGRKTLRPSEMILEYCDLVISKDELRRLKQTRDKLTQVRIWLPHGSLANLTVARDTTTSH